MILEFWQTTLEALRGAPMWLYFLGLVLLPLVGMPVSPLWILAGVIFGNARGIALCIGSLGFNFTLGYWMARSLMREPIERWLAARDVPAPPATFTAMVMARISREEWRAERAIDLGFNLAVAVGVLVILMSGAGLAWSLGAFTISVDAEALLRAALSGVEGGRVMTELQTVALAAVLLTMALVVWWWAEAATD